MLPPSHFDSNGVQVVVAPFELDPGQAPRRRPGSRAALGFRERTAMTGTNQLTVLGVMDHGTGKMSAHLGISDEFARSRANQDARVLFGRISKEHRAARLN